MRGKCIHFQGTYRGKETCAAGVDYHAKFAPTEAIACRAPCIQEYKSHERVDGKMQPIWKPWPRHGHQEIPCDKRIMPTEEQIAQNEKEWDDVLKRMSVVMPIVSKWRTWTKTNRIAKQEVIECPQCKGKLHLSQAAYNGHVWGKCETNGCVNWME